MEYSRTLTPKEELDARCRKLQEQMQQHEIDGALILQNTDLFYFAGTIQQGGLYLPAAGEPLLMIRKDFERARHESAVNRIVPFSSHRQIPDILREQGFSMPGRLGMELDVVPANLYFTYARLFEKSQITDISTQIRMIRAVKSAYEIEKIRTAAVFSDRVAAAVPGLLREGIPEVELAGRIEAEARRLGHQGIVRMRLWGSELFYGHVMAGGAASVPSYLASPTGGAGLNPAVAQGASMRPVARNEPVIADLVFALEGYNSDHARIFCIGELPDELIAAHQAMLNIQEAVKTQARAGVVAGTLYDMALEMAAGYGLADYFMGTGAQRIQFVGHGIGLELDEFPFLAKGQKMPLSAGMIIALEPKVIFPGKGVVGIENTHVVTENGLEQLGTFREEIIQV